MLNGFFIAFEGGEGSGKSTQARLLVQVLQAEHREVLYTHEPGGSVVCAHIREIILSSGTEPVTSRAELLLFLADRAQHVETVIRPALERSALVICDRFSGSTGAYQIGARQLPQGDFIMAMDEYARNGISPDLVLYLDVSPEIGLTRRKKDTTKKVNRLDTETLEFHARVRNYFQKQASKNPSWMMIDASKSIEENAAEINRIVNEKISVWKSTSKN